MTDPTESNSFYDSLASYYDVMTRFRDRLDHEQDVLRLWVERYGIRTALDTACGTGLHAIALARLGVDITASDISETMIRAARTNSANLNSPVNFIVSPMQRAHEVAQSQVDAVFCLGNSLPHLLDDYSLRAALDSFRKAIHSNGVVVIQLLNYDRILRDRERIVGIHKSGNREFIRFYDFAGDSIVFNVLTVDWSDRSPRNHLASAELRPYKSGRAVSALHDCGFSRTVEFGDMKFSPFDESESRDLVIAAQP